MDIAKGMWYLHSNGLIHTDLKSSNVVRKEWKIGLKERGEERRGEKEGRRQKEMRRESSKAELGMIIIYHRALIMKEC